MGNHDSKFKVPCQTMKLLRIKRMDYISGLIKLISLYSLHYKILQIIGSYTKSEKKLIYFNLMTVHDYVLLLLSKTI